MVAGDPKALITPDWPASGPIGAACSTRRGGVSEAPFDSLNLGGHTGDDPAAVAENRRLFQAAAGMPAQPRWLKQVHGRRVVRVTGDGNPVEADAAWTDRAGCVCAVLVADCLPVLLSAADGACVGVAHAGWRGLSSGVLEALVEAMPAAAGALCAWLGPAIGPDAFEVGDEVREAFLDADPDCGEAFRPSPAGRWLADLYRLARRRLRGAGVADVSGGGFCTYSDAERFYSYRRDGRTGRMAAAIWLKA